MNHEHHENCRHWFYANDPRDSDSDPVVLGSSFTSSTSSDNPVFSDESSFE